MPEGQCTQDLRTLGRVWAGDEGRGRGRGEGAGDEGSGQGKGMDIGQEWKRLGLIASTYFRLRLFKEM